MTHNSHCLNSRHKLATTSLIIISCYLLAIATIGFGHTTVPNAYAQSLGDTGTMVVKYGDTTYEIATNFSNGKVVNATLIPDDNQLLLDLEPSQTEDGKLVVTLPRALIDSKSADLSSDNLFTVVFSDSEATHEESNSTDTTRTLLIDIPVGTEYLTIVGTQVVPEFPIGILLITGAIVGGVAFTTRVLRMTNHH